MRYLSCIVLICHTVKLQCFKQFTLNCKCVFHVLFQRVFKRQKRIIGFTVTDVGQKQPY